VVIEVSGRPALRWAAAAVGTLLAAVVVLPDLLFGLDRISPFAQLVSFRPLILAVGTALLLILAATPRCRRGARAFLAGLLAVLLVGGGQVVPRAIPHPPPGPGPTLTVLAFNTFKGRGDITQLARLIQAERPDVVALVEAGASFADRLAPLVQPLGYRLYPSAGVDSPDIGNVTAVVAGDLGDVAVRVGTETSAFPYLEISGGRLGELHVVTFHSVAPTPAATGRWLADLALLRHWCAGPMPAVVAGDFNATLDHSALRDGMAGCGETAAQRGDGLIPTWSPSDRTRSIGPQIDHVIATGGIAAEAFSVHDVAGSDHRAVLARLRLPG
jgi:endonuclease/exonuclease/phosphatase (EEP) superfamily protein YafD